MKQLLRFSVSGILGLIITATLFLGMLSLLSGKKSTINTDDLNINFSFVKDFKEPEVKPEPKRKLPEQQEITQAPSMNRVATEPVDTPKVDLPDMGNTGKGFSLAKIPGVPDGVYGDEGLVKGEPGGIKQAIPPMYPPKELAKKTEGWVKLLIQVNEFGAVSSAKVLQAKPRKAFNAAAIKAVRKWKFYPKMADGKAIPFQVTQTIEFNINE